MTLEKIYSHQLHWPFDIVHVFSSSQFRLFRWSYLNESLCITGKILFENEWEFDIMCY